jgi:RNase P subunit RPR2
MKCTICHGPLSRVRTPQGRLNRSRDSREVWRCLVCGANFAVEQSERSIEGTQVQRSGRVWLRVA